MRRLLRNPSLRCDILYGIPTSFQCSDFASLSHSCNHVPPVTMSPTLVLRVSRKWGRGGSVLCIIVKAVACQAPASDAHIFLSHGRDAGAFCRFQIYKRRALEKWCMTGCCRDGHLTCDHLFRDLSHHFSRIHVAVRTGQVRVATVLTWFYNSLQFQQ